MEEDMEEVPAEAQTQGMSAKDTGRRKESLQ